MDCLNQLRNQCAQKDSFLQHTDFVNICFFVVFVFYISLEVKPISWLTVLVSRSKDKNKYTFSGDKHYVKEEEGLG